MPVNVARMAPGDRAEVLRVLAAAEEAGGRSPFGEAKRRHLLSDDVDQGVTLVARPPPDRRAGRVEGVARLQRNPGSWGLEVVVDPTLHSDDSDGSAGAVEAALLEAATDEVRERGGGRIDYWILGGTHGDGRSDGQDGDVRHERALAAGYHLGRRLLQLRRDLPVPDERRAGVRTAAVRPFRPGRDEDAWLEANNRAFAGHPEQGGWDRATLAARTGEPWFDPAGFLLQWVDDRLAGFCWTKVHRATAPPMGEIYVIGVDPAFQGGGRGKALTLAGLDWLAARGLRVGMLYVDAANDPARSMYDSLGFRLHHEDRAYSKEVRARDS